MQLIGGLSLSVVSRLRGYRSERQQSPPTPSVICDTTPDYDERDSIAVGHLMTKSINDARETDLVEVFKRWTEVSNASCSTVNLISVPFRMKQWVDIASNIEASMDQLQAQ